MSSSSSSSCRLLPSFFRVLGGFEVYLFVFFCGVGCLEIEKMSFARLLKRVAIKIYIFTLMFILFCSLLCIQALKATIHDPSLFEFDYYVLLLFLNILATIVIVTILYGVQTAYSSEKIEKLISEGRQQYGTVAFYGYIFCFVSVHLFAKGNILANTAIAGITTTAIFVVQMVATFKDFSALGLLIIGHSVSATFIHYLFGLMVAAYVNIFPSLLALFRICIMRDEPRYAMEALERMQGCSKYGGETEA